MTDDKDELWRTLAKLEGASDIAGSLDLLLHSVLSDDPRGQRYLGWIYTTRNDFVVAGSWYLKAVQQGDEEALADCMECVIALWRNGLHEESLSLAATPPTVVSRDISAIFNVPLLRPRQCRKAA
jgi:TPR repeat protein